MSNWQKSKDEKVEGVRKGHIHVNLNKVKNPSNRDLIVTIIHESTHRFAGTGDFAYENEPRKFLAMEPAERMNNADSYAVFCYDLANG